MKQYITLGEMKRDLSPDDYKINHLLNWLNKKYPEQLDYITIGQMIEFLGDSGKLDDVSKEYKGWSVLVCIDESWFTVIDKNLCDCLWKAVKEILRED